MKNILFHQKYKVLYNLSVFLQNQDFLSIDD
jgi:hypothetical protein